MSFIVIKQQCHLQQLSVVRDNKAYYIKFDKKTNVFCQMQFSKKIRKWKAENLFHNSEIIYNPLFFLF